MDHSVDLDDATCWLLLNSDNINPAAPSPPLNAAVPRSRGHSFGGSASKAPHPLSPALESTGCGGDAYGYLFPEPSDLKLPASKFEEDMNLATEMSLGVAAAQPEQSVASVESSLGGPPVGSTQIRSTDGSLPILFQPQHQMTQPTKSLEIVTSMTQELESTIPTANSTSVSQQVGNLATVASCPFTLALL